MKDEKAKSGLDPAICASCLMLHPSSFILHSSFRLAGSGLDGKVRPEYIERPFPQFQAGFDHETQNSARNVLVRRRPVCRVTDGMRQSIALWSSPIRQALWCL